MSSSETYPVYEAQVGAFGRVAFFKDPETETYCFMFFNGADYTPLYLSEDAAYFVWAFIGCEHPQASITPRVAMAIGTNCKPNFASAKKAGRCKPKKRPSLTTKKKAKSK
jgi:hypothetical protein